MSRLLLLPSLFLATAGALLIFGSLTPETARGDVGGVYSNVPVFTPNQIVMITVTAEDDDGTLIIESTLNNSSLTVKECSGLGNNQGDGECDDEGMGSVIEHGDEEVRINTNSLDSDNETEILTVELTLTASCDEVTALTISGDQPGNHGPDDVTINCAPATPTPSPTPSPTPTKTPTQTPTPTATPSVTSSPTPTFTPQPPGGPSPTPFSEIQTFIRPPSTGSAGLR